MLENVELSDREREVLRLVATGASNKEIAQKLSISANTVKVHLRNIFSKIGVASRTEATVYAIRAGLVQVDGALPTTPESIAQQGIEASPLGPSGQSVRARSGRWLIVLAAVAIVLAGVLGFALATRQSPMAASASPVPPAGPPRWQARAVLPTGRSGAAAAVYEDQIYAIGGETAQGVSGIVERYNPKSDTWTTLSAKLTAVADVSAAVIGGLVYVPGGRLDSGNARISDELEAYDPLQDRWQERAKVPHPVSAYALAAFEGKLYLFGGWDGSHFLDSVYEYEPDGDTWRTLKPMPKPRASSGAAVAGGRIFVIGGYDGKDALPLNEIYLPEREAGTGNAWTEGAPLPAGRYAMGVASISENIYVIGGAGASDKLLPPLEYLPQENKWLSFESPFTKNWANVSVIAQGMYIYGLGGKIDGIPTNANMAYQAVYTLLIPIIP